MFLTQKHSQKAVGLYSSKESEALYCFELVVGRDSTYEATKLDLKYLFDNGPVVDLSFIRYVVNRLNCKTSRE